MPKSEDMWKKYLMQTGNFKNFRISALKKDTGSERDHKKSPN